VWWLRGWVGSGGLGFSLFVVSGGVGGCCFGGGVWWSRNFLAPHFILKSPSLTPLATPSPPPFEVFFSLCLPFWVSGHLFAPPTSHPFLPLPVMERHKLASFVVGRPEVFTHSPKPTNALLQGFRYPDRSGGVKTGQTFFPGVPPSRLETGRFARFTPISPPFLPSVFFFCHLRPVNLFGRGVVHRSGSFTPPECLLHPTLDQYRVKF